MTKETEKKSLVVRIFSKWLELQETVNGLFDSSQSGKIQDKETGGIKQLLEKKEGLFRMKMMGKRVNFSGRSVISPDPNLETFEIGVKSMSNRRCRSLSLKSSCSPSESPPPMWRTCGRW